MRRPVEDQLRRLDWPEPPTRLRARVLADASVGIVHIAWSDRVWFSRAFRWSVAAAVVAMIVINVAGGPKPAGLPMPAGPDGFDPAESMPTARAIEEIGLPADFARSLVKRTDVVRAAETRKAIQTDGGGDQQ